MLYVIRYGLKFLRADGPGWTFAPALAREFDTKGEAETELQVVALAVERPADVKVAISPLRVRG